VGRIAADRTLRRLGARQVPTCEVPVVFDPETAAEILGHVFRALSGYSVFRNATFLQGRIGETVASPLLTVVDEGRRPARPRLAAVRRRGPAHAPQRAARGRRPAPLPVRHLRGAEDRGALDGQRAARRGGGPSVGPRTCASRPGATPPEEIVGSVERGLYVTDLIGFGVDLVSGDYSQGAAGQWIEKGRFVHPVHEVTIAGNLKEMLRDVDAVGNDLEFRGSSASPTLRVRKMTVSGS
jgi:PmbA protein